MPQKTRLDFAVFGRGLCESREKAKALIMAGAVYLNGERADKAGAPVCESDEITLRENPLKFVSRGGLKLEKATKVFPIDLKGAVCADIGASTGGFTDCMLSLGASRVYAVDVGYGQLAWKLRCDERVINLERTNFRYVTKKEIPEPLDFASVDVSFISLRLILPALRPLMSASARAVCLIKPQFEAGREKVGKRGVVREESTHIEVLKTVTAFMLDEGFSVLGLDFSPIKGPEGNIEYLAFIAPSESPDIAEGIDISAVAAASHSELGK